MSAVGFLKYMNETVVPDILRNIAERPDGVTVEGAAVMCANWHGWQKASEYVADGSYLSEVGAMHGFLTAILHRLDETRDAEELLPLTWGEVERAYGAIWQRRGEYADELIAREVERRNAYDM